MGSKTVACVIARTVSTRLPLKVLRKVTDELSMIDFIVQRLKLISNIDDVYICTSRESVDDILEDVAAKNDVKIYRGSPDRVIERLIEVGEICGADNIVRVTGDNVFTSYEYLEEQIKIHNENKLDYTRIIDVPVGATSEVMTLSALKKCYGSIDPSISEYLMLFMFSPNDYNCGVIKIQDLENCSDYTLTVDTPEDYVRTRSIIESYQDEVLRIKLKEIIELMKSSDIPNCTYSPSGKVKLPYGKEITFEEFKSDMNSRIELSKNFTVK